MCISRNSFRSPTIDLRSRSIIDNERALFSRFRIREYSPPRFAPHVDRPETWAKLMRNLNPDTSK